MSAARREERARAPGPAVVAVDGPAAAGKGTLARRLALAFALPYLDTGLLYRAVAGRVLRAGADPAEARAAEAEARALGARDLDRDDLRGAEVDGAASVVATHPGVRAALLDFQRGFARRHGGVLDGRDIGTVVVPEAAVKLFVTASPEARAERRWRERRARGEAAELEAVAAEMAERDARDAGRDAAPMRPAPDAVLLDTTGLDAEATFEAARGIVAARLGARREP